MPRIHNLIDTSMQLATPPAKVSTRNAREENCGRIRQIWVRNYGHDPHGGNLSWQPLGKGSTLYTFRYYADVGVGAKHGSGETVLLSRNQRSNHLAPIRPDDPPQSAEGPAQRQQRAPEDDDQTIPAPAPKNRGRIPLESPSVRTERESNPETPPEAVRRQPPGPPGVRNLRRPQVHPGGRHLPPSSCPRSAEHARVLARERHGGGRRAAARYFTVGSPRARRRGAAGPREAAPRGSPDDGPSKRGADKEDL